ncbi:MAG: hypothetical protein AAF297_01750 [Planctomycetota bacterium]
MAFVMALVGATLSGTSLMAVEFARGSVLIMRQIPRSSVVLGLGDARRRGSRQMGWNERASELEMPGRLATAAREVLA